MMFVKKKIDKFFHLLHIIFDTSDRRNLLKLIFFMLFGMIFELFGIGLIFPALKLLTDQNFLIKTYDFFGLKELDTISLLILIVFFFIIFFGVKNLYLWVVLKKYSNFLAFYEAKLQSLLYKGYFNKSVSYFKEKNSSDIITNVKEISTFFSSIYLNSLLVVSLEIAMQISILIMLLYFSWQSTVLIFILFGGLSLFIYKFHKTRLIELGLIRNKLSASQLRNIQEGIGGIKEIKLLGRELFFLNQFENNTKKLASANAENGIIAGTPRLIVEFFAICSVSVTIFLFLFIGKSIIEIIPILGLFLLAAYKMIPSFNKILLLMNRIKFSTDAVNRIFNLLEEFKVDYINQEKKELSKKINFNKQIYLKNISFKYPSREKQILKNMNLIVQKNLFVGIGGESGSGKSTLVDIAMGIVKPDEGEIFIDNHSTHNSIDKWQKMIGYVSQNIFLIPNTIKHNIALGLPDDEIDNDLINEVIKKCSLKKFIDSLELGVNTQIGEGGALISGGQQQRIGIARALYNKPQVLFFDEATSALDLEIEKEILNEISNLKKEFTLIFITHREGTLKYCDEKYIIKDGSLIRS